MELYFLGTGAGMPSKRRNVTSIALRLHDERGGFWLFDAGEGTQHQMLNSPLKPGKLEKLFVTHLHGDHIYGLPGLLTSRSYQGGVSKLELYGPPGIRQLLETVLKLSQAHLSYELQIIEIQNGLIFEDNQFSVHAAKLEHRIESFGFRIVEKNLPGKLDMEKLRNIAALRPGPLLGKLKNGQDVELDDGSVIRAKDVVGPPIPGRILTVLGDTRPCGAVLQLAADADVLVHESTFGNELQSMAHQYYHSTAAEAAEAAVKAGAKSLIMTHISSRYQEASEQHILREAQSVFPRSFMAADHWTYPIRRDS